MKQIRTIIAFILILGKTMTLPAQDRVALKLTDAVDEALAHHPVMQAARARVDAASSRATEVRSALLPQLRLSGRAAYLSEVPEFSFTLPFIGKQTLFPSIVRNYSMRLSLQQTLFAGSRLSSQLDMAERNASATEYEMTRDRSDLVLNVTIAYWNLYRAAMLEQVLAQSVQQITSHLADVEQFRRQGLATDVEVLRVQTQLSEIRLKHIEAQSNVHLAQMALNSLTGRPLQTNLLPTDTPDTTLSVPGEDAGLENLMAQARTKRPELSAGLERRTMQEAGVSAARSGWFPQLMLTANYDYARPNQRIVPPKDVWEKTWDVGVSLQWNIWDWFATASQAAQAEANLAQAEASLAQLNDAVALEAAQNYFRLREARERISVAGLGRKQAEEGYRVTQEKFRRGLASNSDLLDAEVALLQAKMNEAQALVDHAIQRVRLLKSIGLSS